MLTKEQKAEIVKKHAADPKKAGSVQVQVALLTKRIEQITEHLKTHKPDHSSRRGLLQKVGQRKALLIYLGRRDPAAAVKLRADLNLR